MKRHLIAISVLGNFIFAGAIIRHFVLAPTVNPNPPLTFFCNGDKLQSGLPKSTNDVLFLGDSQFAAYPVVELSGMPTVKNRGIYYDSSRGVLKRVKDIVSGHPAKIFIECGINDLENSVPIDHTFNNVKLAIYIIKIKSPSTKVYILSVLPTALKFGENPRSIEAERVALNNKYKSLAHATGGIYINLDSTFKSGVALNKIYDVGDQIHLNALGYIKMTELLKPHLIE
ncbi:GDSL-type esterase/lipase family protein [Mucilaginibacter sp. RB4R14]|uniref:GDSL-type esterase/lipase family protein n=1 Tax=Mucilaginibacter aurantiaciroseus TaxID=2949308 RepID=UPI002090E593|nr:GDSL-type esterase/lipase family protein [Mucilaginibacter aurantiaciroseus]MCO5936386.1 GDSL-type esterase/lipase family protein [Mucilaginibacter aurantiaciroseus]